MSWRTHPMIMMELRGADAHADSVLGCTVQLPVLPWTSVDRDIVRALAVQAVDELLRTFDERMS